METSDCPYGVIDGVGCSKCDATKFSVSPALPLVLITPRIEYLINPNPNQCEPATAGLEVAFSKDNYMAVRAAGDRGSGFILSQEAAIQLADLINLELNRDEFDLAGRGRKLSFQKKKEL